MYGGQSTHLPLKVNTSGVIPPIFASSILLFPATIANFIQKPWMQDIQQALSPGSWAYMTIYVVLIIFFCYFYTAVTFNPIDVADNRTNRSDRDDDPGEKLRRRDNRRTRECRVKSAAYREG